MIKVATPIIGQEEINNASDALRSGRLAQGPYVKQFEEEYADYLDCKHVVAVNSGTKAEELTLKALDIGVGDEVVIPSITFFSTASAVLNQNASPVFTDVNPDTLNMCPESFKEQVTRHTVAVVPVHLYGWPCEMKAINEYAEDKGITVIEDCCQSHGATYHKQKIGTLGDAGFFSFYATKPITTGGEGGAVSTDDKKLADRIRILRNHGMTTRDDHLYLSGNHRMNEIQAAVGCAQLKKLDYLNRIRATNSEYLLNKLTVDWCIVPKQCAYIKSAYFWCPIFIDEEKLGYPTLELRQKLYDKGIETRHRYTEPIYRQKALNGVYRDVFHPNAEKHAGKVLGLPNHPRLTKMELDYIIETVEAI